ncbi:DegT/DnrJ/EryC1/StrS family aminotransferase [Extibacter muris]|uniref:DegT/DnrJ/EryC1/StrS family aminotransferase n=1 Tax=Extibacter muris TaxID=1796622 RepID=UPI001D06561B|nr:DegT/DnrJ/EryC1/StrS family aminotransferase [Extibacter muris]MCB6203675.1 DegT/DnrJ/EryC1/StrS family aminotransferase [Extibacter muris]MCQ4665229.1 DegT/DnrJ/EryC1/StrS family aminotransferase [Extibacter muris]MCQ4694643.1 DegT/DnrJ/EryC1/StrS family aminotransferase [Extibacter muris]
MQFRDLNKQYEKMKFEMDQAIGEVLGNGNFIGGVQIRNLEKELAEYVGVKHCITCGNGTDALTMALMAWNIREGDAVFVPDFTFFASGEVVSFEGATPVFYDVDEKTYNADIESLEKAIKEVAKEGKLRPKVIIAVDLFGLPADYVELEKVAKKYGLLLLEDGAQGFGGRIGELKACSFGDMATTSFFPAKPLGCYGDGGAIFTDDDQMALYLQSVRAHGKSKDKYDNVRIGWNSRLDTLQAAVLQVKLRAFRDFELENINSVAQKYMQLLGQYVVIPIIPENYYSSWAQFTIQLPNAEIRNGLQQFLKEFDIPSMIYYPKAMHKQSAFEGLKQYVSCKTTEKLCQTVLSLPMHPYLEDGQIEFISGKIIEFIRYKKN